MNQHKPILSFIFSIFHLLCLCALLSINIVGMAQKQSTPIDSPNPLNCQIRMNLPLEIKHVDQAILYVLGATPYKLALGYPASDSAAIIAMQPVPPESFEGEIMTIADALLMLIGEDNQLLVDPNNHMVSFERIPFISRNQTE